MPIFLESIDPTNFLVYGILFFVGLAIQLWIIRTACKIDAQLNNQKATIWLLIKLAQIQGVDAAEIQTIRDTFKIS